MKPELISISEAARRLGISRQTATNWCDRRKLLTRQFDGHRIVIWRPQDQAMADGPEATARRNARRFAASIQEGQP